MSVCVKNVFILHVLHYETEIKKRKIQNKNNIRNKGIKTVSFYSVFILCICNGVTCARGTTVI